MTVFSHSLLICDLHNGDVAHQKHPDYVGHLSGTYVYSLSKTIINFQPLQYSVGSLNATEC